MKDQQSLTPWSHNLAVAGSITLVAIVVFALGLLNAYQQQTFNSQQVRNAAVDGCMQNARYTWQEYREATASNSANQELLNTTNEPNRFWYRLCMQEKSQEVKIDI